MQETNVKGKEKDKGSEESKEEGIVSTRGGVREEDEVKEKD